MTKTIVNPTRPQRFACFYNYRTNPGKNWMYLGSFSDKVAMEKTLDSGGYRAAGYVFAIYQLYEATEIPEPKPLDLVKVVYED